MADLTPEEKVAWLGEFIPKYLWEVINHPAGYIVGHEEFNERWNLNVNQGDHNSKGIYYLISLIMDTVLPELALIDETFDDLQEVLQQLLGLSNIESIAFFNNGFEVTHKNSTKVDWTFDVDELGQIETLHNETYNRAVSVFWNNTER